MEIILTILVSLLITEFVGYFLHRLLHSERVPWLSKSHMTHHLKDFGPQMKQRTDTYESGARERINVVGVGLEWIVPSAAVYGTMFGVGALLGVPISLILLCIAVSIVWATLTFNYIHDGMHKRDFWMLRIPILRNWFKKARRSHDIHHIRLSNEGRMDKNFGICFFFMDRLFGTFSRSAGRFNARGYEAAQKRYKDIL